MLTKLLPLITDSSPSVRTRLLALFRALPPAEVKPHVEKILMYVRGGMTHLSNDIRAESLNLMEWLLEIAGEEVVSCPGGWMKTLNSFSSMLGWNPNVGAAMNSKGWTSASKTLASGGGKKAPEVMARQISVLGTFLGVGFKEEEQEAGGEQAYWDCLYRLPQVPNAFGYLNIFGVVRDEEGEMYPDRESRKRVFDAKWRGVIVTGMEGAKKEGGLVGRAAARLEKVLGERKDEEA